MQFRSPLITILYPLCFSKIIPSETYIELKTRELLKLIVCTTTYYRNQPDPNHTNYNKIIYMYLTNMSIGGFM